MMHIQRAALKRFRVARFFSLLFFKFTQKSQKSQKFFPPF